MKHSLFLIAIVLVCFGCSSDNGNSKEQNTADYDTQAMLTSWADNLIIPAFSDYQEKTEALNTEASAFVANPTQTTLSELRNAWLAAYKTYQHVGIYDLGKATELHLLETANIYPTNATTIDANIASGDYNLGAQTQFASQGFPALDYLLYGLASTDEDILAFYTTHNNAANYKVYITDLTSKLNSIAEAIVADWEGTYRDSFISNSNAVTGSVNQTANNFVKNLEKDVRAPKVGIPAGVFSDGTLFTDKVEAFYKNDISKDLLIEAITASRDFFQGKTYGTNTSGPGLKAFLDAVDAEASGTSLSSIIVDQYAEILTTTSALDNSFSEQITTDNSKMLDTYDAIQQNVVYLKVDMISALGLTIDYVDGDGD
ncbi:imelysin family protein [Formosa haliotis]|uniref:imelysin family protein n=1 Tax=Formosa haliotis TaxID=1555194 RepID=UPI000824D8B2|nr:imelysin family protein [Formosa haliotis]